VVLAVPSSPAKARPAGVSLPHGAPRAGRSVRRGLAFNLPRCHPQRIPADGFGRQLRAQLRFFTLVVPGRRSSRRVTARNNADSSRPVTTTGAVGKSLRSIAAAMAERGIAISHQGVKQAIARTPV
jgi:hypothetical protein